MPKQQLNKKEVNPDQSKILDVVFVCYENMLATSITLPMELLKAADTLAKTFLPEGTQPKLCIRIASNNGHAKHAHTGIEIGQCAPIQTIESADIIFLPALWRNPFPIVKINGSICGWLKKMFSRETTVIAGVGTGCCFMAEAGLLDGRVATTHWYFFDRFQARYPQVKLQKKYFITQSGRLYCTGSVNALADLTVHFISQHYGEAISTEVERHFFHDIRQNYHKLALLEDQSALHADEAMLESQTRIQHNYSETFDFDLLAKNSGMSRRNFDRRFKAATGYTPLSFLQKKRIEAAKELLKNSNLSIAEIVFETGYQDSAHFAALFKKHNGTTPRQYRTTVRAKLFRAE